MAFNTNHKSISDSEPVFLYSITIGPKTYYHTAAELPITVGAITWEVLPGIIHSDVSDTGDAGANEVTISVGHTHPIAVYLSQYVPAHEITVVIQMLERGDTELALFWSGVFISYKKQFPAFDLICAPSDYEVAKPAMAPDFGPDCQWTQYDINCQLNPGSFIASGEVLSISGLTINTDANLTAVAADHFQGGYIEITGEFGQERAWILSQSGNNVDVDRVLPAMASGIAINCVPSCRGDFTRCNTVFSNRIRFVGAPHATGVNPYRGDGVNAILRNN